MTTSLPTGPPAPAEPLADVCSHCGTRLTGPFCHACGAEIRGTRLDSLTMMRGATKRLLWFWSRLGRTLFDLTIRPAEVCWIYLSGNRDRYIHPIPYALFALLSERLVLWLLRLIAGMVDRPGATLLIPPSLMMRLEYLPVLLAIVVIWRVFFRGSGYNLAETFAVAVYTCAHFILLWTGFAFVAGLLPIQGMFLVRWSPVLQAVLVLAYLTYAGRGVFRENPALVAFKIAVSVAIPVEVLAAIDSILSHR
jgi:hypothetical protein